MSGLRRCWWLGLRAPLANARSGFQWQRQRVAWSGCVLPSRMRWLSAPERLLTWPWKQGSDRRLDVFDGRLLPAQSSDMTPWCAVSNGRPWCYV